ncbi:SWI/SNF complex subunit SWI3D [Impatiens glandulifera]|uniref:SWI/SNF complex subunit SWI3D n=1 Tax=Impatiens glandulifera TaxID=253017 RepID=UPI001FB0EF2A|nr:SWI/SNF complex subunit SWI3D [Impatiens glandulifera]
MEEKRMNNRNSSQGTSVSLTPNKSSIHSMDPPSSRRRGGSHKRKATGNLSTPPTTSSKRQSREKPYSSPLPPVHNGPCTRARQSPNAGGGTTSNFVPIGSSVVPLKRELEADMLALSRNGDTLNLQSTDETPVTEHDLVALEAKIEAEFEAIRSRDVNDHVVPIPAGWFSWTKIHQLEERTLPSFFNGKLDNRTPEIYKEIRDWIMKKFHGNPNVNVELNDLKELSCGEMDARQEVMEFLDYWGLINFHPFPKTDSGPVKAESDVGNSAKEETLIEKLYSFEAENSWSPVVSRTSVTTPAVPSGFLPDCAIAEELLKQEGPSVEYHCNSCSADCSRKRYHCQKQADFDLCSECFNNGKFDPDMSPTDFILMEPAEAAGASGGKWTDQETLLLLEAIELYKENWNEIAEHVATKTRTQCILHFIQMPIEDTFIDCDDEVDDKSKENVNPVSVNDSSAPENEAEVTEDKADPDENQKVSTPVDISKEEDAAEPKVDEEAGENCALKALEEAFEAIGSLPITGSQISFADTGNPVMALAAYLVKLVEPDVITAATQNSLKYASGSSGMLLAMKHSFILEDPPEDKNQLEDEETDFLETDDKDTKNVEQSEDKQNEKKSSDGADLLNKGDDNLVAPDKEVSISSSGGSGGKVPTSNDSPLPDTHEEGKNVASKGSSCPELQKDKESTVAKEPNDPLLKTETSSGSVKDLNCKMSEEAAIQDKEATRTVTSTTSGSLHAEQKDPEQTAAASTISESPTNADDEERKDEKNEGQESSETTKDNTGIEKLKLAATTAISAAAVKARLLAYREEDEIQQLTSQLIEKQLHKLESKLAFFSDMESVVMRVREQLEKSKQKLYQERAQIIASRLGAPPPTSKPTTAAPTTLPINRVAMGFANSGLRPGSGMGMASQQRPMISRPLSMSSTAPSPVPPQPTAAGSSQQHPVSVRPSKQL